MVSLPNEVLRLIFPQLVQKDKLECMTVCRQWHNVIYNHSLFRVIFIQRQNQLDQLIFKVKRNPILGRTVERLTLQLSLDKNYDAKILIRLFPNIRELAIINLNDSDHGSKYFSPRQDHPWCRSMEKMEEPTSDVNTKTLLLSGSCKNLTYISVKGNYSESPDSFFRALNNAPALKKLHLKEYGMGFQDLELLHQTVPYLHSLLLDKVMFCYKQRPCIIKPATSVKCLLLNPSGPRLSSDGRNPLLPYISQKYTHLEEFDFMLDRCRIDYDEGEGYEEIEGQQRALITSYMTTLGPRLKTLSLKMNEYDGENFAAAFDFGILDKSGCRLMKLNLGHGVDRNLLLQLVRTTQAQYIESLTVNRMLGDSSSLSISLQWLRRFTVLKELTLHAPVIIPPETEYNSDSDDDDNFYYYDVVEEEEEEKPVIKYNLCLTQLLNVLSKKRLETLRLYNSHLKYNASIWNLVYPWLKSLTLCEVTFEAGVDLFISRAFPNLRRLIMESCFFKQSSFSLPSTNLSYLEIINTDVKEDFTVMVTTLRDGQQRLYNSNIQSPFFKRERSAIDEDIFNLPPIYSQPFDRSKDNPMVEIVCNSLYTFFMRNIRVLC